MFVGLHPKIVGSSVERRLNPCSVFLFFPQGQQQTNQHFNWYRLLARQSHVQRPRARHVFSRQWHCSGKLPELTHSLLTV